MDAIGDDVRVTKKKPGLVASTAGKFLPEQSSGRGTMRSMVEGQFTRARNPSTTLRAVPLPMVPKGRT